MDACVQLRVAVVGGGIAGLAAAEQLTAQGHHVELFDAQHELGGRIAPAHLGEREICLGGKNVGAHYTQLRALLARRGDWQYEHFGPDSAQVVRGRVRVLAFRSPSMRARLAIRLLTRGEPHCGVRLLRLAGRVRQHEDSRFLGDWFFADLARAKGDPALPDYLGQGLCRDVIRHTTVRMNGAEPQECYLGNLGSNLALAVDRFDQLAGEGFGPWIRAVMLAHRTHPATPVAALAAVEGRVVGVVTRDGARHAEFDGVVLAVPAHEAARILWNTEPQLAALLGGIRYFPVGVVVAEYDRPVFPERFAALSAPASMALSNAGSYGLHDRQIVRFTFSGRAARARVVPDAFDPEALLGEAHTFLTPHTAIAQAQLLRFTARAFDPGLCAYRCDHAAFLGQTASLLDGRPGLALAGDYIRGASLEACVRSGQEAAERLVRRARAQPADAALATAVAAPAADWFSRKRSVTNPTSMR